MDPTFENFVKMLLGSGGVFALLVLGLKWLDRDRDQIVQFLQTERTERITLLEKQSIQCSNDRIELHKNMTALQNEVRTLYKSIIAGKFDKNFFDETELKTNEQGSEASTSA